MKTIKQLNIEIPQWIDQEIDLDQVRSIYQGGCASGAYMPAVIYHDALMTMNEHGDDVLEYLDECGVEISGADLLARSWAGMACILLSAAAEAWASSVMCEIEENENEGK